MRYHYDSKKSYEQKYGEVYYCDHPVYRKCTLYRVNDYGLAIIQQYFNPELKHTWWGSLPPALADDIFTSEYFYEYFSKYSRKAVNGIYPTVTVRQIMWGLKMKPLPKERWETTFDHCPI